MKVNPKNIFLINGHEIILRSAWPSDAENMLKHLCITHTESYKNMNQSAEFWKKFPLSDQEKKITDFESSKSNCM